LVRITRRASSSFLVKKGMAQGAAGIGQQRIHRPIAHPATRLSIPSGVARSAMHRQHIHAGKSRASLGHLMNFRFVGRDHHIITGLGAFARQFIADAGGGPRDHRQGGRPS